MSRLVLPAPRSLHAILRAGGMFCGIWLVDHRLRAGWTFGLVILAGVLLVIAVAWPAGYARIDRTLQRFQRAITQVFSWVLLALVFAFVFVPGRLALRLGRRLRLLRREKRDTYWETSLPGRSTESFERQY